MLCMKKNNNDILNEQNWLVVRVLIAKLDCMKNSNCTFGKRRNSLKEIREFCPPESSVAPR